MIEAASGGARVLFAVIAAQSEDDDRRVLGVLAYLRASAAPSRY